MRTTHDGYSSHLLGNKKAGKVGTHLHSALTASTFISAVGVRRCLKSLTMTVHGNPPSPFFYGQHSCAPRKTTPQISMPSSMASLKEPLRKVCNPGGEAFTVPSGQMTSEPPVTT